MLRRSLLPVVASLGLLIAISCEQPAGPEPDGAMPSFNVQSSLDELAARAEPFQDYLAASSYRALFGRPAGSSLQSSAASGSGLRLSLPSPSFASAPRDGNDVLVNDRTPPGLGQSEVSIASHGATIVAAWNDARGFFVFNDGVSGWGVSNNKGKSFTDGGSFPRMASPGFFRSGDPTLAVSNGGDFFFGDLCFDFATTPFALSGICVTKGRAAGGTVNWGMPVYAASSLPDFLDKPFIEVDRQGNDVYASYTRFGAATPLGQIEVAASHDGGSTFGAPVVVAPSIPGTINQGSEPAVGPDGELYVVWEEGWQISGGVFPFFAPRIMASKSTDGGATFSAPVVVATIGSIFFPAPLGYNRSVINDFPRIDVARTGPYRGEVYVTFHSGVPGDGDIYVTHSPDGFSWSAPVLVNDDGPGAEQFWPDVHVEPGGNVDVIWYDRRLAPGTAMTDIYWSQSVDGGATFRPNVRVSDVSSDWLAAATDIRPNFGDYNALVTSGNRTFAGWGDGRLGDPDVFFSELRGVGKSR